MPSEEIESGSSEYWIRYAISDLELARVARHENILLESLCFHAQQAVEKAFKAVLIIHNRPFPRTHNLTILFELMPPDTIDDIPTDVQEATGLSEYAVASRYPGEAEPVTEEEYHEALQSAETVVKWAKQMVKNRNKSESDAECKQ